jgi:hypothetical protein
MLGGVVLGSSFHEGMRYATHPVKEAYRLFGADSNEPVYRPIDTIYGDRALGYTYNKNQYTYSNIRTKYSK